MFGDVFGAGFWRGSDLICDRLRLYSLAAEDIVRGDVEVILVGSGQIEADLAIESLLVVAYQVRSIAQVDAIGGVQRQDDS